uniref:SnoaL-like domain-containing protein n=1 Tax=Acrobeloides nanus TaxID=290746 RepID=A0A914DFH3_9BILA
MEQAEIDRLLKEVQDEFISIFETKDIDKILDEYHPQAVIVHRDGGAIYGREGLRKFYEGCFKECSGSYKVNPTKNKATPDGEYLIQEGYLECEVKGEKKKCNYLSIFKRVDDGKYMYYRDEVDSKFMDE